MAPAQRPRSIGDAAGALAVAGALVLLLEAASHASPVDPALALFALLGGGLFGLLASPWVGPLWPWFSRGGRRAMAATLFAICGVIAVFMANAVADPSPARQHVARVQGTHYSRGMLTATVPSWSGGDTSDVPIPPGMRAQLPPGACVAITTHAGRLGWEWVAAVRRVDCPR